MADLDADGFDDLIIGAGETDIFGDTTRVNAGQVTVIAGREDPLPETMDLASEPVGYSRLTVLGATSNDRLGDAVTGADVNADGYDDVILGVPGEDPGGTRGDAGAVNVHFGDADFVFIGGVIDALTEAPDLQVLGDDAGDRLGEGVAAADLFGDGAWCVVAGAPLANQPGLSRDSAGEVTVIRGAAGLSGIVDLDAVTGLVRILGRDNSDEIGRVFTVGDVDGDGRDDLFLGAPMVNLTFPARTDAGEVVGFLDSTLAAGGVIDLDATAPDFQILGADSTDLWGEGVAAGLSLDRMGVDSLTLGGPGADPGTAPVRFQGGELAVFRGSAAGMAAERTAVTRVNAIDFNTDFGDVIRVDLHHFGVTGTTDLPITDTITLTREAPSGAGLPAVVAPVRWQVVTDHPGAQDGNIQIHLTDAEVFGLNPELLTLFHSPDGTAWSPLVTAVDERSLTVAARFESEGHFAVGEADLFDDILNRLLGVVPPPGYNLDVNGDGVVDVGDAVRYLLLE